MYNLAKSLLTFFYQIGLLTLAARLKFSFRREFTAIMFHRIYDGGTTGLPTISISLENFKRFLKLIKNHYNIIGQENLFDILYLKTFPSMNSMILTFDDAYEDVFIHAAPELLNYSFPSLLFPVINTLKNKDIFWWDTIYCILMATNPSKTNVQLIERELPIEISLAIKHITSLPISEKEDERMNATLHLIDKLKHRNKKIREDVSRVLLEIALINKLPNINISHSMGWDEIIKIRKMNVSLGGHTMSHEFLTEVGPNDVFFELNQSRQILSKTLDDNIISIAYPSGFYTDDIVKKARQCGYRLGFTTESGRNSVNCDPLKIKRFNLTDSFVCDRKGNFSEALTLWRLCFS